jgi:transposase-like protein
MCVTENLERNKPCSRQSFSKEFKAEVVEPVRLPGNEPDSVARDLDLTERLCVLARHRRRPERGLHDVRAGVLSAGLDDNALA